MSSALVGRVRLSRFGRERGERGRGDAPAGSRCAARRAGEGRVALGHRAQGLEGAAAMAAVFVGRHELSYLSGDIGMSVALLTALTGPLALGRMSKSKICVGSQSVAQALGISTT